MERLELPFELRQKSRLRARLASGEEVGLMLARGTVMRGGDVVRTTDGREVEIVAAKEKLLHIESDQIARVAYHLGNRHVPAQIGDGFVRIAQDHVLEELAKKLGARVSRVAMKKSLRACVGASICRRSTGTSMRATENSRTSAIHAWALAASRTTPASTAASSPCE